MPARNVERNSPRISARNLVRTSAAFALATSLAISPLATRITANADDQPLLGYSADSPRASLNLSTAALIPWLISTTVSLGQSRLRISYRSTTSPGCSNNISNKR